MPNKKTVKLKIQRETLQEFELNVHDVTLLSALNTIKVEIDFYSVREELGNVFYKNVGIVRDKKSLEATLNVVNGYIAKLPLMGAKDSSKMYNTNKIEFLEFKNTLELSRLVLVGAIAREESRGAHFRVDFPKESELFEMHTIIDRDGVVDAK